MKKREKKSNIRIILLIIFAVLFLVSATMLIVKLIPKKNEYKEKYKKETSSVASEVLPDNPIDFAALQGDNADVIGWIKVDGTVVDYPILMSGIDKQEDYYINHDINLSSKKAGSIYVQRLNSNDFSDFNTVIYGHNMANGSMFGTLKKFRNKNFFNENRYVYIYTPGHILKYEIVSAFVHDDRHLLNSYSFISKEGRQKFIDICEKPNTLVKNVVDNFSVKDDDRLITLSTCTSADNERYLVVAKLIEDTKTK